VATVGQGPTAQLRVGLWDALTLLGRNGDFARLYAAELISFAGDWFATVAILGLVNELTGSAALTTLVLVAQMIATAVFSPIGGYLADRLNRKRLMIGSDIVRVLLALGYLLVDGPGDVWLAFVLTAGISALSALFTPASNASVPNLVDPEDLPAANVLVGAAWGTMLAIGAALGGLVAAVLGRDAAFVGDAVSFALSALLLVGIRRRFAESRAVGEHPRMAEAIRETVRYARRDRRVLALLTVKGGFGLGAGVIGLLPILALEVFDAGDRGTGILWGFRGIGALVGPFLVSRFTRDLRSVLAAIGAAFVVYGVFYATVPLMPSLWAAALLVMLAHLGGGAQWTLSTYGLQRIVPDRIRGRVFSFDFGLVTLTLACSILVGGWAADNFDPRAVMAVMAGVALSYAVVWSIATRSLRRSATEFEDPEPDSAAASRV
jgi:predicted MFS family arabinose efflux permease